VTVDFSKMTRLRVVSRLVVILETFGEQRRVGVGEQSTNSTRSGRGASQVEKLRYEGVHH
jgi:hypothetical protein